MRLRVWTTVVVSLLLAGPINPMGAAAQNGYSFFDADASAVGYPGARVRPARACRSLVALAGYDYSIISARRVTATDGVPAHCAVTGMIRPEILFEVNLPAAWNGRFYMYGNGGFAGTPPGAPGRAVHARHGLARGFATAYTNTGHDSRVEPLATFAYHNRSKEVDYAFRAVHLTAVTAKAIIAAYYDRAVSYAYWDGCSTGGRQGLISAQRFPADFDGIVAGAPVLDFTGTMISYVKNARALAEAPIDLVQVGLIAERVYARCDAADGLEDGLIDDPRRCDFDPATHLPRCESGMAGDGCFTSGQIAALEQIYGDVVSHGQVIFPGQPVGAEAQGRPAFGGPAPASGWNGWIVNERGRATQLVFAETFLKFMAFPDDDPDYDWRSFDLDADPDRLGSVRDLLDAIDPDLSAFADRGGKIISYFGWADAALNPLMGIDYYEQVNSALGAGARDVYRLFMVPGMFHCRGGRGTDRFDAMTPLIDWVERGVAPERPVAARVEDGTVTMTRPLCPYPQVARYRGSGAPDAAASFVCVTP